jgi:hypothetical protein
MKNHQLWDEYNTVAEYAADKLGLSEAVKSWTIDEIAECDTFSVFNRKQNKGEHHP